jgi:hypothetical protein
MLHCCTRPADDPQRGAAGSSNGTARAGRGAIGDLVLTEPETMVRSSSDEWGITVAKRLRTSEGPRRKTIVHRMQNE